MNTIRFAGAQIPVTRELEVNIIEIKKALDWASVNSVDFLLTPEGSLSGYIPDFDTYNGRTIQDLYEAEKQVVEYAVQKGVNLCLGTKYGEEDERFPEEYRRENQIRFYSNNGTLAGKTNKFYITEGDHTYRDNDISSVSLQFKDNQPFSAAGLICNDFWGGPIEQNVSLPIHCVEYLKTHVIFHSSNGLRGILPNYDEITNAWHEGNLRMMSFCTGIPIITVDTCYMMNGDEYHGKTSSQSGILLNGKWLTDVPRTSTQYFYHDFDYDALISYQLRQNPDQETIDNLPPGTVGIQGV